MDNKTRRTIIGKAKDWMRTGLIASHRENTLKLADVNEFNINPFLLAYLGYYFSGNVDADTLARVLVYPRVLGTSITTSFGTQMQRFITEVLKGGYGSAIAGIDIEFEDQIDNGRHKYAQLKSGPNAINHDDVTTIKGHFRGVLNRARTNNLQLQHNDLVFCLLYGEAHEKNAFVREVENDYPVFIGQDFWHRFTGDKHFYKQLILAMGEVAKEVNMSADVERTVQALAPQIKTKLDSW